LRPFPATAFAQEDKKTAVTPALSCASFAIVLRTRQQPQLKRRKHNLRTGKVGDLSARRASRGKDRASAWERSSARELTLFAPRSSETLFHRASLLLAGWQSPSKLKQPVSSPRGFGKSGEPAGFRADAAEWSFGESSANFWEDLSWHPRHLRLRFGPRTTLAALSNLFVRRIWIGRGRV